MCLNCDKRAPGCHGTCPEYQEAKRKKEQKKQMIIQSKKVDRNYNDYQFELRTKYAR